MAFSYAANVSQQGAGNDWQDLANAQGSPDGNFATCDGFGTTQLLRCTGFDFGPLGANLQVTSIDVEIRCFSTADGTDAHFQDVTVELIGGSNNVAENGLLPTSPGPIVRGGLIAEWGESLFTEDVEDENFGILIGFSGSGDDGPFIVSVDSVLVTISVAEAPDAYGVYSDAYLPVEWLATINADAVFPAEWEAYPVFDIYADAVLQAEILAAIAADGDLPAEWTDHGYAGTIHRDATFPAEWLGSHFDPYCPPIGPVVTSPVLKTGLFPVEWLALDLCVVAPVEWIEQAEGNDAMLPVEWAGVALATDATMPAEWTLAAENDAVLPASWRGTSIVDGDAYLPVGWKTILQINSDGLLPADWLSSPIIDRTVPFEIISDFDIYAGYTNAEWNLAAQQDAESPVEVLPTAQQTALIPASWPGTSFADRTLLLELLADVDVYGETVPAESLLDVEQDAELASGWIVTVLADGILATTWGGAATFDFGLPAEWMTHFGRTATSEAEWLGLVIRDESWSLSWIASAFAGLEFVPEVLGTGAFDAFVEVETLAEVAFDHEFQLETLVLSVLESDKILVVETLQSIAQDSDALPLSWQALTVLDVDSTLVVIWDQTVAAGEGVALADWLATMTADKITPVAWAGALANPNSCTVNRWIVDSTGTIWEA